VKKVAVQLRQDHETKPGGDVALARAFARRMRARNLDVTFVSSSSDLMSLRPSVLLASNVDQPLELLAIARAAKRIGTRVCVYALHHPTAGVRAYLESGVGGARGLIARIVRADPQRYLYTTSLLRRARARDPRTIEYLWRGPRETGTELARVIDDVLVSGESEAKELVRDFPELRAARTFRAPHPVDIEYEGVPNENPYQRSPRFFVAGRIESRKNPVSVVRVAKAFPNAEFVFAGALNTAERAYGEEFLSLLARTPNCRWVKQLPLHALLQHIRDADAVISPSWFEVMSLINLYASALGTFVIGSAYTYDGDFIGDQGCARFDPSSRGSLPDTLASFMSSSRPARSPADLLSRLQSARERSWHGFDGFCDVM